MSERSGRGPAGRFVGFAEQVLKPLVGVTSRESLRKLSADLWSVTFGRSREVVFAVTLLVSQIVVGVAIRVVLALGAPISVPIAGFLLLFGGYLLAATVARIFQVKRWLVTPEMDAILRANAALLQTESSGGRQHMLRSYRRSVINVVYGDESGG